MSERFGELIRRRREALGIKSFELAHRLKRQPSIISRIETGAYKEVPPVDVLEGLERELGISQAQMLESLGYHVMAEGTPTYDETTNSIAFAVSEWTPKQKAAIWTFIRGMTEAMDDHDPPDENDEPNHATG